MPFAKKWCAMMAFPLPGGTLGDFEVEHVDVRDVPGEFGQHGYALRMVLRGPGGQQGVRRALKDLVNARPLTFSSYGNPYQLWCGRPEIERLGDKRYAVTARGAGVPIALEDAPERVLAHLVEKGLLAGQPDDAELQALIATDLDDYRAEVQRSVSRYRGKLRRVQSNSD